MYSTRSGVGGGGGGKYMKVLNLEPGLNRLFNSFKIIRF